MTRSGLSCYRRVRLRVRATQSLFSIFFAHFSLGARQAGADLQLVVFCGIGSRVSELSWKSVPTLCESAARRAGCLCLRRAVPLRRARRSSDSSRPEIARRGCSDGIVRFDSLKHQPSCRERTGTRSRRAATLLNCFDAYARCARRRASASSGRFRSLSISINAIVPGRDTARVSRYVLARPSLTQMTPTQSIRFKGRIVGNWVGREILHLRRLTWPVHNQSSV